jgi:hypothetical protein
MHAPRSLIGMACSVAALLLATLGVRAQPPLAMKPSERPHFKSAIRLTTVTVTVVDAEGHLVRDLPREQFEVFEDGASQAITQFAGDRVPISVGILLDASDSIYGRRIADAREASITFCRSSSTRPTSSRSWSSITISRCSPLDR